MPDRQAAHDAVVLKLLEHLYHDDRKRFACEATTRAEVEEWQARARPELHRLVGLDAIASSVGGAASAIELEEPKDFGGYTRRHGHLETEPHVRVPFWLFVPKGDGPFPLAVMPHGHEAYGYNTYAGIPRDETHANKIAAADRDVAVQAVKRGFVAIAPATRGFAPVSIPDLNARHGNRDCRSELIHVLLAGRTVIGERVWDVMRFIDWATTMPEADASRILVMGNSGGGMATTYTAACDTRVTVAVPSCSFATYVGRNGLVHHCDCNTVPGILAFGEFSDVAGLAAPRHLLIVNGREDKLFPLAEVDRAVEGVRRIYESAGVPERFQHYYGEGGHRFYADLMWPFVTAALSE